MSYPERIVCLTEETTEALYLLGEEDRIVGISGFTVRPPRARKEKPRVSAFTSAKIGRILELEPDLVLGFSDMQADIAAELVRHGIPVHVFNQRSVEEILSAICTVGALVGRQADAEALAASLREGVETTRRAAADLPARPRIYFEEWDDPQICGIRWVSELIDAAGGDDVCAERAREPLGSGRIIADPREVTERQPDIIVGSWCGKRFRPEKVAARPGWDGVPAVRGGHLHEIKSSLILQPGAAALTEGLSALHAIVSGWCSRREVRKA